jgi:hypothetical protein
MHAIMYEGVPHTSGSTEERSWALFRRTGKQMRARNFDFCNFHFTLTFEDDDDDDISQNFSLTMLRTKKTDAIGTVNGHLIDRKKTALGGGFFECCDAISDELQNAGCLCCDDRGIIRPALSKIVCDRRRIARASCGGFLYVNEVMINEKANRGSDLGLVMLQALFHNLVKHFTLAALFPAPWDTDDRDRDESDPLRTKKVVKIARHFARVGFAPIGTSGYMFVEQSQIPRDILPKEATSQLEIYEPPAKRELSVLDQELIESICDLEKVKDLVAKGADPKHAEALHHACFRQAGLPTLQYLISQGCHVNDRDVIHQTPLMLAAFRCDADTVCNLISLGADPRCVDGQGETALDAFHDKQQSIRDYRVCFGLDRLPPTPAALATRTKQEADKERILRALGEPAAQGTRKRKA